MFNSHNEIMQANREGREAGVEQERRRVHYAAMTVPERSVADFPMMDTGSAALAAICWNDCRATLLKAIGVNA